ncbi:MAG TPA: MBL fold metallo-hydrolase [Vicinamibacteria bacterium]|nr:MBL fold metallo-hydrolase [Vicinamibacteria bacterium]
MKAEGRSAALVRGAVLAWAVVVPSFGFSRPAPAPARWCELLPRPANAALERVEVTSDWFEVYRVSEGVFAFVEPLQFQEAISYLILGADRALMFDTGMGLVPLRPVVGRLTKLPVEVLNSHTHFDHVGGNAEFERILALDTAYTRANARGFAHAKVAGEVESSAFCRGAPRALDPASYHTRPWRATRVVADGEKIDLGSRMLEVLHVPGHTPDAIALLDRANGLLWTGDSYYDGTIWLYVPETDLDAYERSMARLATLVPGLRRLLPAHNTASAEPRRILEVKNAIREVRAGNREGKPEEKGRVVFAFDGFSILTSAPLLAGRKAPGTQGGSGLDSPP